MYTNDYAPPLLLFRVMYVNDSGPLHFIAKFGIEYSTVIGQFFIKFSTDIPVFHTRNFNLWMISLFNLVLSSVHIVVTWFAPANANTISLQNGVLGKCSKPAKY